MFDKDRFHNQLALNLGYQHIVNDKRINISIDDKQYPDDVVISISIVGLSFSICYKASEVLGQNEMNFLDENGYDDIKMIIDACIKYTHRQQQTTFGEVMSSKTDYESMIHGVLIAKQNIKTKLNKKILRNRMLFT